MLASARRLSDVRRISSSASTGSPRTIAAEVGDKVSEAPRHGAAAVNAVEHARAIRDSAATYKRGTGERIRINRHSSRISKETAECNLTRSCVLHHGIPC